RELLRQSVGRKCNRQHWQLDAPLRLHRARSALKPTWRTNRASRTQKGRRGDVLAALPLLGVVQLRQSARTGVYTGLFVVTVCLGSNPVIRKTVPLSASDVRFWGRKRPSALPLR